MSFIHIVIIINADKKIVFDLSRRIDLHKISTQQTNKEAIAGKTQFLIELHELLLGVLNNLQFTTY